MARVFEAREQHSLSEGQVTGLTELADRVRALTETIVFTDVDPAELAAVSAEVALLTERLAAVRRAEPPLAAVGPNGLIRQLANPVSGPLNPLAPPIDISVRSDGTACCEFTLSAVYEGPPGFVHGGVSAMVLDQLLGVAAAANGTPGMTATLDLRYRRPTPYGVPLIAEGRAGRTEGRKTYVDAWIIGPDGRRTVEAAAMFIMPQH